MVMNFSSYQRYKLQLSGLLLTLFLTAKTLAADPALSQQQLDTLSALLSETGTPHKKDFNSMVEATQQWRRKPGQERWEVTDLNFSAKQKKKVRKYLAALGLINQQKPNKKQFDYALVLGATAPRMKSRFQHLVTLWKEGVRFDRIIFLSGERPIHDDIDMTELLVSDVIGKEASRDKKQKARPATEKEAARMVYMSTEMPDDMQNIPVELFSSSRTWLVDRWQRGNTRDSFKSWVKSNPKPGSALIVSNQPHLLYQQEVIRQELPQGFITEGTAQQADPDSQIIMILDALALWLHNLQIRIAQKAGQEADRQ